MTAVVNGYLEGMATCLPFEDHSFSKVMSVAALCFVPHWQKPVAEIVRVRRRRFALGLLNRNSLLRLQKVRGVGSGTYRGPHWHTVAEIASAVQSLSVTDFRFASGVFLPGGGAVARLAERALPATLPMGTFMAVFGNIHGRRRESGAQTPSTAKDLIAGSVGTRAGS